MKHEFMKRIIFANTKEELTAIMMEVQECKNNGRMSEEAFQDIWNVFWQRAQEVAV